MHACHHPHPQSVLLQLQAAVAKGRDEEAASAEAELSALGGRASYQAASELTTSRHRTSKWIFSLLTQMELRPSKGQPPLKVLEVCPLHDNFQSLPCSVALLPPTASCSLLP